MNFFVILGRGRSGTTLLSELLNNHQSVAIPGEFIFPINLRKKYHKKKITNQKIYEFVDDIFKEERISEESLNQDSLKKILCSQKNTDFQDLCLNTYTNFSTQKQKRRKNLTHIGDKNPHYALFIKEIIEVFPSVKFIHLIRDYRDNVLSFKKVYFDLNNYVALAYRWLLFNKKINKYSIKYPDNFLVIKYEELVSSKEETLIRICKFLKINFEPKMLDFFKKTDQYKSMDWHENLGKPINLNSVGKWKSKMSNYQIKKIEYVCKGLASKYEYIASTKQDFTFSIRTFPGVFFGWLYTMVELSLFLLPFNIRTFLINYARKIQVKNKR